jgi:hypothetical protein
VNGPVRLGVGDHPQRREPRDVVGVDDLDVGHVRTRIGRTVGCSGGRDRVERVAHGAVADRVEVRLESECIDAGHRVGQYLGIDEVDAAVGGWRPGPVQVRLEHRGGEVLGDPVEQQFHAGGLEASVGSPFAEVQPSLDLLEAAPSVPPVSANDPRRQAALLGEPPIDLDHRREHPGVLPRRDSEAVELVLRILEPGEPLLISVQRDQSLHQVGGTLVECPGWRAVRIAFDPPVGRVGGFGGDAGQLHRPAVDPRPVTVAIRQENRPVRDDPVEVRGARRPTRKVIH